MSTMKGIAESYSVKYIGVIIDSKLKFDGQVKKILQRMACGKKVLKTLSKSLPEKRKSYYLIFRTNSDKVANVITHNFRKTIELGKKTIFYRRKYDRSTDLKLRNKVLPVSFLLKYNCSKYFFRLLTIELPAYKIELLSTMRIKQHDRSKKTFDIRKNNKFLSDSLLHKPL